MGINLSRILSSSLANACSFPYVPSRRRHAGVVTIKMNRARASAPAALRVAVF
jgi:hypothetical protein